MGEQFDAIVVGSGFGGSVMAQRLAAGGKRVCVLERGKAYPPGSFPRSPAAMHRNFWDPSAGLHGLYNLWFFRGLGALVSAGVGGGSLIYANVLLRKDERWFDETWPLTRADLDPHYDEVERVLGGQPYPLDRYPTSKTLALKDAAAGLKLQWQLPKLAVTFGSRPGEPLGAGRESCRLCGECNLGCNYGSKNTLDLTYLATAQKLGAELRPRCEVRRFAPSAGGYTVHYVEHTREGAPTDTSTLVERTLTARTLVLAAGTFGSTYLLLRNRASFPKLSPTLGTRVCGNGDFLSFAALANRDIDPTHGPVITSAVRVPDALDGGTGRGFYLEDAGLPVLLAWVLETANAPSAIRRAWHFARSYLRRLLGLNPSSDLAGDVAALIGDATLTSRTLPLLGMGRDVPDGRMTLRGKWLDLDWRQTQSRDYFRRMKEIAADLADQLGARFVVNPTYLLGRLTTVHPLGGCPMGRHEKEGVVDQHCQVFNYPGLLVADGSIMPGPVGPNPALTIAAVADRAALHQLGS